MGGKGRKRERCGRGCGCGRKGDSTWIAFLVVISVLVSCLFPFYLISVLWFWDHCFVFLYIHDPLLINLGHLIFYVAKEGLVIYFKDLHQLPLE